MDRAPAQCLEGHRFESRQGLRFFSLSLPRDVLIISFSHKKIIVSATVEVCEKKMMTHKALCQTHSATLYFFFDIITVTSLRGTPLELPLSVYLRKMFIVHV